MFGPTAATLLNLQSFLFAITVTNQEAGCHYPNLLTLLLLLSQFCSVCCTRSPSPTTTGLLSPSPTKLSVP
jgi:hypothetical protein